METKIIVWLLFGISVSPRKKAVYITNKLSTAFWQKKRQLRESISRQNGNIPVTWIVLDNIIDWYWPNFLLVGQKEKTINGFVKQAKKALLFPEDNITTVQNLLSAKTKDEEQYKLILKETMLDKRLTSRFLKNEIVFRKSFLAKEPEVFPDMEALVLAKKAFALFTAEYFLLSSVFKDSSVIVQSKSELEENRYLFAESILQSAKKLQRVDFSYYN